MAIEVAGDRPGGLAVFQPPKALGLLMLGRFRFAAKLYTARLGGLPAILGSIYVRSRSS
jgi:hypothetical protein